MASTPEQAAAAMESVEVALRALIAAVVPAKGIRPERVRHLEQADALAFACA